jgi:hypothetical protein
MNQKKVTNSDGLGHARGNSLSGLLNFASIVRNVRLTWPGFVRHDCTVGMSANRDAGGRMVWEFRMNRNQGFGMLLMLLLVVLGIAMLVSPQAMLHWRPPQTEAVRSLYEVLKMIWCTQGGVAMIVLGAIVGALSVRAED